MKKISLLLIAFNVFFCASMVAQNPIIISNAAPADPALQQSQTMFDDGGFIGIGTTNPLSNLSIVTTYNQASGITPNAGLEIGNYANRYAFGTTVYTPVSFRINRITPNYTDPENSANNVVGISFTDFIVTEKGYVGIGTATPQTFLDVNGDAIIRGNANVTGNATVSGNANVTGTATITGNTSMLSNAFVSGSVGIGTTSPQASLDVHGNAIINGLTNPAMLTLKSTSSGWANQIEFRDATALRHVITDDAGSGELVFHPGYTTTSGAISKVRVDGQMHVTDVVQIGNVPIRTGYSLFVENGILAESYKCAVHTSTDWMDFVFDEKYKLKSIDEVAKFVKANKHLPDVPSADEVVCDGIDMAKMDATLLRKIEELTLYVIGQQEEIELLKAKK